MTVMGGFKAETLPWLKTGRQRFLSHFVIDLIIKKHKLQHVKLPQTFFLLDPAITSADEITAKTNIRLVQEDISATDNEVTLPQIMDMCLITRLANFDVGCNNLLVNGEILFLIDAEDKGHTDIRKLFRYKLCREAERFLEAFIPIFLETKISWDDLTPIYRSCKSGNLLFVKMDPANKNFINLPIAGISPILAAAKANQWHVVEYLLRRFSPRRLVKKERRNLDVTSPSPEGETILTLAIQQGKKDIVRLLRDDYQIMVPDVL
jgi:ankyrin repeat protein